MQVGLRRRTSVLSLYHHQNLMRALLYLVAAEVRTGRTLFSRSGSSLPARRSAVHKQLLGGRRVSSQLPLTGGEVFTVTTPWRRALNLWAWT